MKVGCDIVKIERMTSFLEKDGIKRCFAPEEIDYIFSKNKKEETAAGIFAAKEALGKAMGKGLASFSLTDAVVMHDDAGKPYFRLKNGDVKDEAISLSISHDGEYAMAFLVIEEK